DDLGAGKIERQEGFQILFDRNTSDGHENWTFESKIDGAVRTEQIDIDTASPHAEMLEAALAELAHQRGRRHHRHRRAGVKPAQHAVNQALWDRRPGRNVFGETRRVARREGPATAPAIGADGKAD